MGSTDTSTGESTQDPAADGVSRIQLLPSTLADQIAAGEVVERAASVVKELAENAIDAGARRIEIEIQAGGRRLIRVVDDGGGMTPAELRLALARHATSKLRSADDLWTLATFGFRGEALPSIAAVSRMSVSSRRQGADAGRQIVVNGGEIGDERELGMAVGTQIEVRELFFNTPARQKFQKTEATEAANVSEAVLRLALAHPGVHFRLRSNARVALDLPPHRDLGERVRAALARRGAGALHQASGEEGGCRVQAFLGSPDDASTTSRNTYLMVGRRFVRDRSLLQALAMGYGELLERGRYPLAALFVDVDSQDVDVNVHPQKLEVRFAQPQRVYAAVRHVVASSLARAPWLAARVQAAFTPPPFADQHFGAGAAVNLAHAGGTSDPGSNPSGGAHRAFDRVSSDRGNLGNRGSTASFRATPDNLTTPFSGTQAPFGSPDRLRDAPLSEGRASAELGSAAPASALAVHGFYASLRYIGQLDRTYLLCEQDGDLVLIDQHAAHERVAFERLRQAYTTRALARQRLLFPVPIDLDEHLAAVVPDACGPDGLLTQLGFVAEPFGDRTVLVREVPQLVAAADPKPLVTDVLIRMVDEAVGQGVAHGALAQEFIDRVLSTMACHSVVRAGDFLSPEKVAGLLVQLDTVDLKSHCPHGRPAVVRMSASEIQRRFERT